MSDRKSLNEIRVLIVEDSKTQALFLMNLLDVRGYEVKHSLNGIEALRLLESEKPDIIISDGEMPLMDGYDLCKTLKADSDLANIPVILITSMSDPQNLIRALLSGADSFISKPYKIQAVVNCIQTILANTISDRISNDSNMMEVEFLGKKKFLKPNIRQITNFLLSSYEETVLKKLLKILVR
jgi:CheY-like chemotaxis protein